MKTIIFFFTLSITMVSCFGQAKQQKLKQSEIDLGTKTGTDASLLTAIREFTKADLEQFHYSRSKISTDSGWQEANPKISNGIVFKALNTESYEIVYGLKDRFRAAGKCIFLLENNFGYDGQLDVIGMLAGDKYDVLKEVDTDGINWDIDNDSLRKVIRSFDDKYELELIGASGDWCEFIINGTPADWMKFAQEVYAVCPDVVDQGAGTVELLASEMKRTNRLYFWWD